MSRDGNFPPERGLVVFFGGLAGLQGDRVRGESPGPQRRFCVFDWEDWGMAPRGLDAASLWSNSLAVPALAERVRRERGRDLGSRDGKVMALFCLAKITGPHAPPDDPRLKAARTEAARPVGELQRA